MRLRTLIRFDRWWDSKIPPLLSVAYALILIEPIGQGRAVELLLGVVWSLASVAAYGHLVNDLFDIESDGLAGKPNALASLSAPRRVAACALALAAGFAPWLLVDLKPGAWAWLAVNYLLPTVYSMPGVRLKERGVLGIVSDAAGAHAIPTLFILAAFSPTSGTGRFALKLGLVAAATCVGIKGILNHQVADRGNDLASGVETLGTRVSAQHLLRFLTAFNALVEIPVVATVVTLLRHACPLAVVAFAGHCVVELTKLILGHPFYFQGRVANPEHRRPNLPLANNFFYEVWLPTALAIQLATASPSWRWLPALHVSLFFKNYADQARDLYSLAYTLIRPLFGRRSRRGRAGGTP